MVAGKSPEPLPSGWSEHVKVKNGRKIKYYTNAPNGKKFYSKKAVICYMKIKGNFRGQNRGIAQRETRNSKRSINSQSLKTAVNPDKSPEWLPPGWIVEQKTRMSGVSHGHTYKCYIDPFGRRFYSKPEVSRHLKIMNCDGPIVEEKKSNMEESSCNKVSQNEKATDDQSHTSRKPKSGMGKQPSDIGSSVVVQSNLVDGLPPGWIKEIKTRVHARGIRRDPHYVDPVSGYVFFSKKDALRYIETGDIEKCATRPKKRDPGSGTNEESPSRSAAGRKAGQSSTKRQILTGRESSESINMTEPQDESIKKRLRSAVRDAINTQEAEVKTEKPSCKTANEGSGTKPGSEARPSDLSGESRVTAFGNDAAMSTPQSDNLLHHQKLPESEKEKQSGTASVTKSRKSRKNKSLGTPARFSKRLAGHTPEEVANLGLGERVFRAAIRHSSGTKESTSSVQVPIDPPQEVHSVRNSGGTEADASSVPAPSNPDQETPKHIDEPTKATEHTCEMSSSTVEKEAVPEKPITEPVTEKQDTENPRLEDSHLRYPFGDCWSDPCLEFAFKTLTGAIPVEDCLAYEHSPHQQFNPSYAQSSDGCFDLPIFDSYSLFPNDFPSSHPGLPDKHASQDLPPTPPPFLSPRKQWLTELQWHRFTASLGAQEGLSCKG